MMPKMATCFLLILAATTAQARAHVQTQLAVRFRHEPGVETRMLLLGHVGLPVGSRTRLRLAGAGGVLDNSGLAAYGLDADILAVKTCGLRFWAGAAHEQWPDWQTGENRIFGLATVEPRSCLALGIGLVWRAAIFDPVRYASPFYWRSAVPELNLAYLIDWTLVRRPSAELGIRLANHDLLFVHNPQQLPVSLHGRLSASRDWHIRAGCGTAVTGLSGPILSFSETSVELGVSHDF